MTVIDGEAPTTASLLADRAYAALPHQECVTIVQGHSVAAELITASPSPVLGIASVPLSLTLVDLVLVSFLVAAAL